MNSSRNLGLVLMAPAIVLVVLFFLVPVALTAVFSFTTMSTSTGITGGAYQLAPNAIQRLRDQFGMVELAQKLGEPSFVIDERGLATLEAKGVAPGIVAELRSNHLNETFTVRRDVERMIRSLRERPSTPEVKLISAEFSRSLANARFADEAALFAAVKAIDAQLTEDEKAALAAASYSGWTWTTENFRRMVSTPDTARTLFNTLAYVSLTLVLFNTGFAMILALAVHYMPERPAGFFRILWLLPRITPPVIYVLMWKWLAWDTGFLSAVLDDFGVRPRNWMLDSAANAWVVVVFINGLVGASMGMLIFSSAIKAIPQSLFYASEVDGAYRWQQIRHIILPQLRWPILFVTCYQTLSLLTSFEYILLSTNGGPGGTTEVWALAIYHTALNNYAGNLQYGYGAAMALVLVVIGIVLSLVYLRLFNYGALVARPLIEH
ncbi:ABC transporter permease [Phyllobacterium brassicacearum]|uniref:ABC transporter permease n=1 Tax=Phyllobacterium brassicacearum TaxID=314235 RepID=A0A2P7B951_9HYPH|nr:sugar ABC transporter permease [Phyllobacterium brassicacearum]PSH62952.1 ABC transporter permease [Phyllobacterium brassicacearum]TDQ13634.1 carbohydrate ABC transporter membrane protein 1 (CUT1 family) [Phyllobacterium brassicacearum]